MLTTAQDTRPLAPSLHSHPRHRRFWPWLPVGLIVPTLLAIIAGGGTLLPLTGAQDDVAMDCTLIIPAHPLTAQELETPYQLVAATSAGRPCLASCTHQPPL